MPEETGVTYDMVQILGDTMALYDAIDKLPEIKPDDRSSRMHMAVLMVLANFAVASDAEQEVIDDTAIVIPQLVAKMRELKGRGDALLAMKPIVDPVS